MIVETERDSVKDDMGVESKNLLARGGGRDRGWGGPGRVWSPPGRRSWQEGRLWFGGLGGQW